MKILTYNILEGGVDRLEHITQIIRSQDCDIVALQEVNGHDLHSICALASAAGIPYAAFGQGTTRRSGRAFHVATLSKYPIIGAASIEGMHHAAFHTIHRIGGLDVSIINAHLCPHSEDTRLEEITRIIDTQKHQPYKIILGDLNSLNNIDSIAKEKFNVKLRQNFLRDGVLRTDVTDALHNAGYTDSRREMMHSCKDSLMHMTFPTPISKHYHDGVSFTIDYVFLSKPLALELKNAEVIVDEQTRQASDHYPLCITLNEQCFRTDKASR